MSRILFFDIDGTLIDITRGIDDIPLEVKKEIERLKKKGDKAIICSGRPKAMLDKRFWDGTFDGYVLSNGAYVEIQGESLFENRLDYDLCVKTIRLLEELHCEYMIASADKLYLNPHFQVLYHFFVDRGHYDDLFTMDFQLDDVLKKALKIEANVTNKDKEKIEEWIKDDFSYVINFDQHGSENAFEFYSPTISKAVGIQKVLDYYHVDKKDTYAFGDGENDLEMIKFCGVGVAMGNSCQTLKEAADIVCKNIDDHGLVEVLKTL